MVESIFINQDLIQTKDLIIIDILKDGKEFLEDKKVNHEFIIDSLSIMYQFLKRNKKQQIPHNLYKFFIAAYYMVSRHPWSFPAHESKKNFCRKFGIEPSSLEYSLTRIREELNFKKILDDKNYPYFIDLDTDIAFKLMKNLIKNEVDHSMMNFLLYHQPVNSQILCEELITKIIFEMKLFPEELFRQFYEIVFELVDCLLSNYHEYVELQRSFFI
ncbi:MAG: hypothetical protein EU539_00590 [Promethearchaeota archaeon]|nr:MAG: hypothetical protein EU539_00590 [Candidatus Lokiarchaeota archaeon]